MNHATTESARLSTSRRGLVRGAVAGGLLLSALWLSGCSSSSFFVVRDSHHYSRGRSHHYSERSYYRHSHRHGHGYVYRDRDCRW